MWRNGKKQGEPPLEEVARALAAVWRGKREQGSTLIIRRGSEEVAFELAEPEDRFGLLLLAILAGAKVQEASAVATFNALRERGLTSLGRLAGRDPDDEVEVQAVLQEHYRALANKAQKGAALFAAAERVVGQYEGDVANVHRAGQPWQETLRSLREFPHLKSRAYWLCRELKRHGHWSDLEPQACAAVDTSVKLALWRLGFVGREAAFLREISTGECLRAVGRFFAGDALPLFYQGEFLCRAGRSVLCSERCGVAAYCRRTGKAEDAPNTEQPFALSTGTCG